MIEVRETDGSHHVLDAGRRWHVDDLGQLHVISATEGNVATFARGAWSSVRKADK